jgi:hypothetical protein
MPFVSRVRHRAAHLWHEARRRASGTELHAAEARAAELEDAVGVYEPGHYYSALPRRADAVAAASRPAPPALPGIDLRVTEQLALAADLGKLAEEQPFGAEARPGLRYQFDNGFFAYDDGLVLHCMLRHLRPRRVVEVGSGWSSACMLDTNELFLDGATQFTFIDPETERLESLLRDDDRDVVTVHKAPVQAVDPAVFAALQPGDVLFIDSSHVTKAGSDVNLLLLDVVPSLPPGVIVHVHDIPWPFEYAVPWAEEGRFWNEAYLLRALLTHNPRLRILWFNSYLADNHVTAVQTEMPAYFGDGLSLWLEIID